MVLGYSIVHAIQRALRKLFSLGGVLGLAISLYFAYRRNNGRRGRRGGRDDRREGREEIFGPGDRSIADTSGTVRRPGRTGEEAAHQPKREDGVASGEDSGRASSGVTLPQFILSTYKKPSLVISIPSILTVEPGPIVDAATAHGPTVSWLKSHLQGHYRFQTYLVCHVADDVGEAVVSAMLEHCGVVPDMVPAHRVLFVEDLKSTVSVVRQLDPGAYLGADEGVCGELRRFYKERGRIMAVRRAEGTLAFDKAESRLSMGLWA
jgi:hypothetical protein